MTPSFRRSFGVRLGILVLLTSAAVAQATRSVPNIGVFSGSGVPVSMVHGWTDQLGLFTGTGTVTRQLPNGILGEFDWHGCRGDSRVVPSSSR